MIAGITIDSGAGALLLWLAIAAAVVLPCAVIADGYQRKQAQRRHPLAALGRIHRGDDR